LADAGGAAGDDYDAAFEAGIAGEVVAVVLHDELPRICGLDRWYPTGYSKRMEWWGRRSGRNQVGGALNVIYWYAVLYPDIQCDSTGCILVSKPLFEGADFPISFHVLISAITLAR
jgi:hypothetical protein